MNRVVVITGAGGVLCSSFAKFFAEKGDKVALLDLNLEAAQGYADEIVKNGGVAKAYKCNVLDMESINAVHEAVLNDLGKCDILINGAGGNSPKCTTKNEEYTEGDECAEDFLSFFNIDEKGFDFVFNLNLKGVLMPSQAFIRDMLGREGCSVLNISSMNAYRPLTKIPAYSAAKAGVSNFTQWLAVHFAKENIRVNAIAPGFFVTNQNRGLLFNEDGSATPRTEKILRSTPMGRFGESEELLGAVEWLCDADKAGFVTGVTIPIDGGFSAYSGV
ncbi:MAG: SDR family oxidoreductase [Oscillospiraceae bacterium]|nr:SDR family oxidoreductase [Oscillospiraceae bacterium]